MTLHLLTQSLNIEINDQPINRNEIFKHVTAKNKQEVEVLIRNAKRDAINTNIYNLTRVIEIAVFYNIAVKDESKFLINIRQLYNLYSVEKVLTPDMHYIMSLYLLSLLSSNKTATYQTTIESLPYRDLPVFDFVKAVNENLNNGNFINLWKLWESTDDKIFEEIVNSILLSIRCRIADCLETFVCYKVEDVMKILRINKFEDLVEFMKNRNLRCTNIERKIVWKMENDQVYFEKATELIVNKLEPLESLSFILESIYDAEKV